MNPTIKHVGLDYLRRGQLQRYDRRNVALILNDLILFFD